MSISESILTGLRNLDTLYENSNEPYWILLGKSLNIIDGDTSKFDVLLAEVKKGTSDTDISCAVLLEGIKQIVLAKTGFITLPLTLFSNTLVKQYCAKGVGLFDCLVSMTSQMNENNATNGRDTTIITTVMLEDELPEGTTLASLVYKKELNGFEDIRIMCPEGIHIEYELLTTRVIINSNIFTSKLITIFGKTYDINSIGTLYNIGLPMGDTLEIVRC